MRTIQYSHYIIYIYYGSSYSHKSEHISMLTLFTCINVI